MYQMMQFDTQKSPVIIGSFAENDLQLEASYGSLPLFTTQVDVCVDVEN